MSQTLLIVAVGFVLNAGLALLGLILADRHRRRHRARLQRARATGPDTPRTDAPRTDALPATTRRPARPRTGGIAGRALAALDRHLAQSGLRLGAGELLVQVGMGIMGFYAAAVLVLGLPPLPALVLAVPVPPAIAWLVLRIARARYRAAFTAGLPEALDVFARGLRAGRPVADSLGIVVDSAKGPVLREFARCHDELIVGTTLCETLDRLGRRVPTPEVCFFAVATALQAETGGNLIETMENLATQLRERRKLRRKARALSSEARASALILASLPFAVALVIALLNGAYLEPLHADPRGRLMALAAVASIGTGIFLMIRMGKLDV